VTDVRAVAEADDEPMLNPGMNQAIAADRQAALRSAALRERLVADAAAPTADVPMAPARSPHRLVRALRRLLPA
jgi:hypothetical protein